MLIEGLRRSIAAAGLTIAMTAVSLSAQGAPAAPRRITLDNAIEIALRSNPSVLQAENSARLSSLAVEQQHKQLLPTLNLTTGTGYIYGAPGLPSQDPTVTAGLAARMQVGNVYSTVANIRQAQLDETGSGFTLVRSRQTVVFNIMSRYLSLVQAQEQLAVQRKNLESVETQERQIEALVQQGRRPISDLYQQQASSAGARLSLLQAERGLVIARMGLIQDLQLDPFGDYDFVVPELAALSTTSASLNLERITQQALAQRPDLRASEVSLSSAEQGIRIAAANRWPTLSVQLGYNSGSFSSDQTGAFFNQLDQGRRGSLSFNVSVPILDFTQGVTRERANIALDNARINFASRQLAVSTEVETAYLDLQLAEQQLTVAEAQLQAADRALEMSQTRYDVNVATLVELTQAQTSQLRAASELVNARYELIFRSRLMDYYLGDLEAGPVY
ncbi:MAG: TolC family protein [Gemmatimonadota bacterium]|jgi:outer membrane protein|nr:TolC family protein [Gemmatimonadota bacterium]